MSLLCFSAFLPIQLSPFRPSSSLSSPSPVSRTPSPNRRVRPVRLTASPPPDSPDDEHDIPSSAVDWNSEWAKFSASGMRSMAPKGREPVSKQQLAASRAQARVNRVVSQVPSRQKLFADWRFWLAIIATLSIFSAAVQSMSSAPPTI